MLPTEDRIPITNRTMELSDCRDKWFLDEKYDCWCLEDIRYTEKAEVPAFQRLSVFVPKAFMNPDGTPASESRSVPIVFENNSAGYMQMPHTWLGGPRCYAEEYLNNGLIYITCGCRGRESRNEKGVLVGKSPVSLIDLKTALRFLRHNRAALPGDFDKIISVGWSAGGAMSTLLGVTGDHPDYDPYLKMNGAFMDESDAVFAAQIYCPIIDLEHADLAYEWCFGADRTCEDSPAGPAETMTPFKEALSAKLAEKYIGYVNGLGLKHPLTGQPLTLDSRRGGSFYRYLMNCLSQSATEYLSRLESGSLPLSCTVSDYLAGNYVFQAPAQKPGADHHAGPDVALRPQSRPMSLGEMMLRPPKGMPFHEATPPMEIRRGSDKRTWLAWDGKQAVISDLDAYVLNHRRRMKPCTSFDKLTMDSGENQEFGSLDRDYVHFNPVIGEAIRSLLPDYPQEAAQYADAFDLSGDAALNERVRLINPMSFIGTDNKGTPARHFRIRVGASDADTSFSISMTLAVRLANAGFPVDYALVWDQPHCRADYPDELVRWIKEICAS